MVAIVDNVPGERQPRGLKPPPIQCEFEPLGVADSCIEVNPGTQVFALDTPPGAATLDADHVMVFAIGTPTGEQEEAFGDFFQEGELLEEECKLEAANAEGEEVTVVEHLSEVQEFSAPSSACSTPCSTTPRNVNSPGDGSHESASTCESGEDVAAASSEKLLKMKQMAAANEALLDDVSVFGPSPNGVKVLALDEDDEDGFGSDCELPDCGLGD